MKKIVFFTVAVLLIFTMLTGCGSNPEPASSTAAPVQSESESGSDLTPIYAGQIQDGTYNIEVSSSSSMFRIVNAKLTVRGDAMSAVLTLSGDGYEKLYMGTGEQALADSDDKCIYFVEDAEGMYTYEVPVEALNKKIDMAAWSIRKQEWYDRVVVFLSAQIPKDAITP